MSVLHIHGVCPTPSSGTVQEDTREQSAQQEVVPQDTVPPKSEKPIFAPQQQHNVAVTPDTPASPSREEQLFVFVRAWGGWIVAFGIGCLLLAWRSPKKESAPQA